MIDIYARSIEAQIIGRVFTCNGSVHFVLDTDAHSGMARCSRRTSDGPGITFLPMTDIHRLLIEQHGGTVSADSDDDAFVDEDAHDGEDEAADARIPSAPPLRIAG